MKNLNLKKIGYFCLMFSMYVLLASNSSCDDSDSVQRAQQEKILAEGTAAVPMPAIKNFREKRILKDIIELRDQNILTYTYVFSEMTGMYTYLGESIGFAVPAATQFTNPMKPNGQYGPIPQADPNGLFSPASAEGSWIMMLDPVSKEAKPQYSETRLSVFTYKLRPGIVKGAYKD